MENLTTAERLKAAARGAGDSGQLRAPRSGWIWQAQPARRKRGELAIGGRANAPRRHLSVSCPVRQPSVVVSGGLAECD